jgi:hypothetical protein
VAAARTWVRGLPVVDPPFGFFERMLRPAGRWRRGAAAAAVGVAAATAVITMARPAPPRVQPAVSQLVEDHAASASATGDPVTQLVSAGAPVSFQP